MMKKRNQQRAAEAGSDSSSDEEPEVKHTAAAKAAPVVKNDSGSSSDEDAALAKEVGRPGEHGGETRKEREARMAEEAKARYQELHLAGKTTEAKADMARLAEVRRRREEAALKAKAEKEEKEAARNKGRRNPNADVVREAFM